MSYELFTEMLRQAAKSVHVRLRKELIAHKVRAGTCSQITAILYQLHAAQIDLTVAFDGVFHGASGLREGGRIQDHQIVLLALGLQLRK